MQKFATTHSVDFRWLFLESGHGKGVADAVGAVLKRLFDEAVSFDPDNSFDNALDLMNLVKSRTEVKLFIYDKVGTEQQEEHSQFRNNQRYDSLPRVHRKEEWHCVCKEIVK